MLKGKNILLGVCGSIAAYKAAHLIRLLKKKGADVKVLMTPSSIDFITPLTLSTLSKNPVYWQYAKAETGEWNNHVELAKWANYFLIAPATSNTLAKMASGICDNLLLATYFSMKNPVIVAPAMDLDMYHHPANRRNMQQLQADGNRIVPSEFGELASGLHGEGRMAEPEHILDLLEQFVNDKVKNKKSRFIGKKVLITAGPSHEPIDPVRFIGNRSSGKMGYALAKEGISRGAEVSLISGPVQLDTPRDLKQFISVKTAAEMHTEVLKRQDDTDLFMMAAAVSDYRSMSKSNQKIKKSDQNLKLDLEPTEDILHHLGHNKQKHQEVVGFALETENEEVNAKAKLERKKCDLIVLNSLNNSGTAFDSEDNQISIFDRNNNSRSYELKSKSEVAKDIFDYLENNRFNE